MDSGVKKADPRSVPIDEMQVIGKRLSECLLAGEFDELIVLCTSCYRSLGVDSNSDDLEISFDPCSKEDGGGRARIDVIFTFPKLSWGQIRYLEYPTSRYRELSEDDANVFYGVMMLQHLYTTLHIVLEEAAHRIFMPLVDEDERDKYYNAMSYALAREF